MFEKPKIIYLNSCNRISWWTWAIYPYDLIVFIKFLSRRTWFFVPISICILRITTVSHFIDFFIAFVFNWPCSRKTWFVIFWLILLQKYNRIWWLILYLEKISSYGLIFRKTFVIYIWIIIEFIENCVKNSLFLIII